MKTLNYVIVLLSVIFALTASAKSDTKDSKSETNGYFGISGGLHIAEGFYVAGNRMGAAYGRDISKNRYLGSFERFCL